MTKTKAPRLQYYGFFISLSGTALALFLVAGCLVDASSGRRDSNKSKNRDSGTEQFDDAGGKEVMYGTADGDLTPNDSGTDEGNIDYRDGGIDDNDGDATKDTGLSDGNQYEADSCKMVDKKVLVLHGGDINESHAYYQNALSVLGTHRLNYETRAIDEDILYVENEIGKYGVVIVTDYDSYESLDKEKKQKLDRYCRGCNVGVYFVYIRGERTLRKNQIGVSSSVTLNDQRLNEASDVPSIAKNGGVLSGTLPGTGRLFKVAPSSGYVPVALATNGNEIGANILSDDGSHDGIRRVFHGHDFTGFWFHELLFLDGLQWLSPVNLEVLRDRWIGIDIDDIFMSNWNDDAAQRIVKIQKEDVDAMVSTQRYVSSMMEGQFRFSLGFNSGYYQSQVGPAPYDDVLGDTALVANRAEFNWFDHLPRHEQANSFSEDELVSLMQESKAWAAEHGILDYVNRYAVTPSHSGITNRYTPLYNAWREVWDIRYTSATRVNPGFEYLGVRAMPRQNFQIWSGHFSFNDISKDSIDVSVAGGRYYRQIINSPVAIFMTHQANYARDRILLYVVEHLVDFLHKWTNFRLIAATREEAINKYFELFLPAQ